MPKLADKGTAPPNASIASSVFMDDSISALISEVNKPASFTAQKQAYMIGRMKYGERLKAARKHAGLSQAALADMVGISQPGISQLEGSDATGSEFTVQFAKACNVRSEWLALEDGPMVSNYQDHRIAHVVKVMEALPDLFRDEAMREVDSLAELAVKVTAKKVSNGQ